MTDLETDLLDIIEGLVRQHCNHDCDHDADGVYDSGFIGVNAKAMDALCTHGLATYVRDGGGRWRSIKFQPSWKDGQE